MSKKTERACGIHVSRCLKEEDINGYNLLVMQLLETVIPHLLETVTRDSYGSYSWYH